MHKPSIAIFPLKQKRRLAIACIAIAASVLVVFCLLGILIQHSIDSYSYRYMYTDANKLPPTHVAIVFGAQVYPNHTLSAILRDRVEGGIKLYQLHKVQKLLMTGDNSSPHYNEVAAMKDYAIQKGVPSADIYLDYAGFDTYDSCYRAHAVFRLTTAILVTQGYHMSRALYLCRGLKVSAVGLALPDFNLYPDLRVPLSTREFFSDIKGWVQLNILHSMPRFMGPQITIH